MAYWNLKDTRNLNIQDYTLCLAAECGALDRAQVEINRGANFYAIKHGRNVLEHSLLHARNLKFLYFLMELNYDIKTVRPEIAERTLSLNCNPNFAQEAKQYLSAAGVIFKSSKVLPSLKTLCIGAIRHIITAPGGNMLTFIPLLEYSLNKEGVPLLPHCLIEEIKEGITI